MSTEAIEQNKVEYAKVYSARVGTNPEATLSELEEIARNNGSAELLTFPIGGNPCEAIKRELIRSGESRVGYPGFSVRPQAFLAKQRESGRTVTVDGTSTTRATVAVAGTPVDFTWQPSDRAGDPASVVLAVGTKVITRNLFYPVDGAADPFTRPRIIHVVGLDEGSDIVQVFEYFAERPEVVLESHPPFVAQKTDASAETVEFDPSIGLREVGDQVNFGSPTRGWPGWHFDTGWWPGEGRCDRSIQGRVYADVAAGMGAHVEGDFRLDLQNERLRPGSGSGNVWIDVGAEAGGQGSICVNLPWPLPDIDWQFNLADIDLRVEDTATFSSFLLDGCAEARDSESEPALCALPPIPIPGLSGNACLTIGASASFEMCGNSISVSDGNSFDREGQWRGVSIDCDGYHETANYNETGTVTAGVVVGIVIGFDITIYDWSWNHDFDFDVLSLTAPGLSFSRSDLDFDGDPDCCDRNSDCRDCEICNTSTNLCEFVSCSGCDECNENHGCTNYACCSDSDCGSCQTCNTSTHTCQSVSCSGCNECDNDHGCTNYACCSDSDCGSCQTCNNSHGCTPVPACCTLDSDCDDSQWCNGPETCDIPSGNCQAGSDRCTDPQRPFCNEANHRCDECNSNGDCAAGEQCVSHVCQDLPPECGNGPCEPALGEDRCTCPEDCGEPPSAEADCDDGEDNDCDGLKDCDDSDCTCPESDMHPADESQAWSPDCSCATCKDSRVELCEATGYAAAWKRGEHNDIASAMRGLFLWLQGECYQWDNTAQNWVPTPCQ